MLEAVWWQQYVPLIRFVDCTGLPVTQQASTLAIRDFSDSNTLVLAGLIAPVVIIAEDRDILASGLAYEQWRQLYGVAEVVCAGKQTFEVVGAIVLLTGYALAGTAKLLGRAIQNPWALAAAGLGALLLYSSAEAWTPRLRATWGRGAAGRREFVELVAKEVRAGLQRLEKAQATWSNAERGTAGGTLLHDLAGVLAIAEHPMTRTELVAAMGFTERRAAMDAIHSLLHEHHAFHEAERGRWQLGREGIDFGMVNLRSDV